MKRKMLENIQERKENYVVNVLFWTARDKPQSTNVDEARRVLKESGLPIISADDLADAAEKAVAALKHQSSKPPTEEELASFHSDPILRLMDSTCYRDHLSRTEELKIDLRWARECTQEIHEGRKSNSLEHAIAENSECGRSQSQMKLEVGLEKKGTKFAKSSLETPDSVPNIIGMAIVGCK
ncbi:hypothetical protein ANCCEY_10490 [Ancylostoma ceylanicum]|uniref:Uncharacterized protein n=1 Tax=Ancylostoma ceylanicum TaxID=53326 RepID=A0A0D6LRZ8_9BILA|nr:hypothetical protein ANCCEY_10490 [Ancylostoma ceylanicum]